MTDRELMQMALDALDRAAEEVYSQNDDDEIGQARRALRARLAQPEPKPEPVAVVGVDMSKIHMYVGYNYVGLKPENKTAIFFKDVPEGTPLYTAPPQREWQGLTDEEILEEYRQSYGDDGNLTDVYFARAIEFKLKEKNT